MASEKRQIFREKSLQKLSSPDRLDQLLRIVRPQVWLMLLGIGLGLALAISWSILGRIPETATGTAILVRPKQVVYFESSGSGQIKSIAVKVGDRVRRGDLLASLSMPTLETDLQQAGVKLEHLKSRVGEIMLLDRDLVEKKREHMDRTRELMRERQKNVRESAQAYKLRTELYLAEQRANIDTARNRAEELGELLQERYEAYRDLEDQGLSSRDQLVEQRTRMVDNELEMANLSVRDQALKLQENAAREVYEEDMDLVRDLEIQLSELDLEDLTLRQSLREDELDDAAKIEEIELRIEFLQKKLQHEGSLYSEYNGTVLEVSVTPGAQVGIGQRMGRMEAEDGAAELKAAAFFTIRDGKKIQPGLKISVSPANVEKERFGGIVGYVESVTDYPVTTAAAANQIGDPEIARTLLGGQSRIGVLASLEADDTFTGFKWTSGEGPDDFLITAGTTAEVRVTVRERRPITLVFPFLERLSKR